jgi:hypothetical protein
VAYDAELSFVLTPTYWRLSCVIPVYATDSAEPPRYVDDCTRVGSIIVSIPKHRLFTATRTRRIYVSVRFGTTQMDVSARVVGSNVPVPARYTFDHRW